MNYYEHHLGDYLRDTAHLSMLEDGAYRRLLDAYYIKEAPLPIATRDVFRLVRAQSKQDREAVETVLREFFTETPEGWRHSRCDREIERYAETIPEREARRENDRERQRRARERRKTLFEQLRELGVVPPFDAKTSELEALLSRSKSRDVTPPVTRDNTANQYPDTRHQTPESASALSAREPSAASAVCIALKAAGVQNVNPSHPTLKALVDAGAEPAEFVAAAAKSEGKGDRFAYVLAVVEGDRKRAAETAGVIHRGPLKVVSKQAALEERNRAVAQAWARGES